MSMRVSPVSAATSSYQVQVFCLNAVKPGEKTVFFPARFFNVPL